MKTIFILFSLTKLIILTKSGLSRKERGCQYPLNLAVFKSLTGSYYVDSTVTSIWTDGTLRPWLFTQK